MATQVAERPSVAASKSLKEVASVRELLVNDAAKKQIGTIAAKHMNPERMTKIVANALRTTPKLAQCDPMSLLGALMTCASIGLEPNTVLGHAYLVPFDKRGKNEETGRWEVVATEVQLILGYKGLIDLARRSGHITSISANIHYSDDEMWEYEEGTEARLRHRPGAQQGEKLHAYAIAQFKDGGHAYIVLPWQKVMMIRDGSQGWQSAVKFARNGKVNSPWATHEDEMAKKTAIRALAKMLPLSIEFASAVSVDEERPDFAAFAAEGNLVPGDAPTVIEGEIHDSPEPERQDKAKTTAETSRGKGKAKSDPPKKADPPAEQPNDTETHDDDAEYDELGGFTIQGFVSNFIEAVLPECGSEDDLNDVLVQHSEEIDFLPPAVQGDIQNAISERRKAFD